MRSRTVIISIHPNHVAKILSGEKRLEFRRIWAASPIDRVLIYSTNPEKQLVAVAHIKRTIAGSPKILWAAAQKTGGGITRKQLFGYLIGKRRAFALELEGVVALKGVGDPSVIFGSGFRAPQSFRYLKREEEAKLNKLICV